MKEHPVIFSTESVRAILKGNKTQTRRLYGLEDVNSYPGRLDGPNSRGSLPLGYRGLMGSDYFIKPSYKPIYKQSPGLFHWFMGEQVDKTESNPIPVKCPYGQIGDRLWVKEAWLHWYFDDGKPAYKADWSKTAAEYLQEPKWLSPMFMHRLASRITLEIVALRAERLQTISTTDAFAEGYVTHTFYGNPVTGGIPTLLDSKGSLQLFQEAWDKLHRKDGFTWERNPFAWVIEFKRIDQ